MTTKIEFDQKAEDHLEEGEENPVWEEAVEKDSELKVLLLNYIGNKVQPEDGQITVHHVVDALADEFPDALMAIAEANWIRGYHQALDDVDKGQEEILAAQAAAEAAEE